MQVNNIQSIKQPPALQTVKTGSTGTTKGDGVRLYSACKSFETFLVSQMLSAMKKGLNGGGFLSGMPGGDFFESFFDNRIASDFTENGIFRLASELFMEFMGREPTEREMNAANHYILPSSPGLKSSLLSTRINASMASPKESGDIKGIVSELANGIRNVVNKVLSFLPVIDSAGKKFGLDKALVAAVIAQESGGDPEAVSDAGAAGLMQLMAGTASELGVRDRFDPELNIMGGSKYLSKMLERYGNDLDLALAAYNAGPGAVDKYGGIPQFKETKAYVDKIKKWHRLFTEIMRGGEGCPEPQKDF